MFDEEHSHGERGGVEIQRLDTFVSEAARLQDIQALCDLAAQTAADLQGATVLVCVRDSASRGGQLWLGLGEPASAAEEHEGFDRVRPSLAPASAPPSQIVTDLEHEMLGVRHSVERRALGLAPGPNIPQVDVVTVGNAGAVGCWVGVFAPVLARDPFASGGQLVARLVARYLVATAAAMRAENQRVDAEQKYRTWIEQIPAVTYYREFDQPGMATFLSPQIEDVLGYSPQCFQDDPDLFVQRLHPDDREWVLKGQAAYRPAQETQVHSVEYRVLHRDGHVVWVLNRSLAVREADGTPRFLIGVLFDITETKQLEQQYLHAQKMEALGQLAGGIAHDFNNILAVILGHGWFVGEVLDEETEAHADLMAMLGAAERAKLLVSQLLAFSRQQHQQITKIHLGEVIADMRSMVGRVLRESIELELELDPGLGCTMADRGQLEQVIMNLLVNARDAMPDGGRLTMTARNVVLDEAFTAACEQVSPGDYVMFCVTDTGVGMDEDTKLRIFEPFFTTKPRGKGTGLGMATVLGLVRQHGGTLSVSSEIGGGTAVRVYLPRCRDERDDDGGATATKMARPQLVGGDERILVVEDDEQVRTLTVTALQRLGYSVSAAADGQLACEAFGNGQDHDLVLSDVIMPGMSGAQLAEHLWQVKPDIPLLFMSGYEGDALGHAEARGRSRGVLAKPLTVFELAAAVRAALGGGGPTKASTDEQGTE